MWPRRGASTYCLARSLESEGVRRYSRVAVVLHWATASFILFNLATGFFMEGFSPQLRRLVVPLHISSGMTVLALTLVRIAWRLTHRPPSLSADVQVWEKAAARLVHSLLYALMLVMPLTGWSIISAHPAHASGGPMFWGILPLPPISPIASLAGPVQRTAHGVFVESHTIAGWILLSLLVLHVAAALKHQFVDQQSALARMALG